MDWGKYQKMYEEMKLTTVEIDALLRKLIKGYVVK
jgi:hypothetical protein